MMPPSAEPAFRAADYIFRFDEAVPRVVFGGELALTGWLFHRAGRPLHGLRAVVRRTFAAKEMVRGRRKRNRPDAAAAYPEAADAGASGFLLELRLGLGRNELEFQLLDDGRKWQTFARATVTCLPFKWLERSGFHRTRAVLISALQRRFWTSATLPAVPLAPPRLAGVTAIKPQRVDLFATSKSNLFMVEIGELVAAGFRELGCAAELHLDGLPAENPPAGTMQLIVAPHEYHTLFLTQQLPRNQVLALTRHCHLLCTEQPETGWFQGSLQWAKGSLGVADIHPLGVRA